MVFLFCSFYFHVFLFSFAIWKRVRCYKWYYMLGLFAILSGPVHILYFRSVNLALFCKMLVPWRLFLPSANLHRVTLSAWWHAIDVLSPFAFLKGFPNTHFKLHYLFGLFPIIIKTDCIFLFNRTDLRYGQIRYLPSEVPITCCHSLDSVLLMSKYNKIRW